MIKFEGVGKTMREIKFRAWHKESKEMFDVYALTPTAVEKKENGISYVYDRRDVILMQYIGQKDINGIKVFTGDIVKADLYKLGYQYMAHPYICEVVFEGFCYLLRVIDHADKSRFKPGRVPKISKSMQYHYINSADNLTVIGNRWDNPELLEVK